MSVTLHSWLTPFPMADCFGRKREPPAWRYNLEQRRSTGEFEHWPVGFVYSSYFYSTFISFLHHHGVGPHQLLILLVQWYEEMSLLLCVRRACDLAGHGGFCL